MHRNRKIRFRKKKSPKGWVFPLIPVAFLVGGIFMLFRSAGPELAGGRVAPTAQAIASEAAIDESPVALASVRPILERTLGLWAQALSSGDYSRFYETLSAGWREKDDVAGLAQAYQPLYPYRNLLEYFPRRGKLVVLESRPLAEAAADKASLAAIRDTLGPETPWLARGEWRTGRSALAFNLNLVWETGEWRLAGLRVEVYKTDLRNNK